MIKRYKNLKLGQKLILIFLVISLIPITLIQMIHYARTKTSMTKQVSQVIRSNLIQISERTNLTLQVYTNVLYQLYVDDDLIHGCLVLEQGTDAQKAAARGTIMEEMRRGASVVEGVRTISLVCPNGEAVTYDTTTDSSVTNLWMRFRDLRMIPPYQNAENMPGMVITPTMKFKLTEGDGYYFHISKRIFDFDHLEKGSIGTLVMSIDEDVLDSLCNPAESGSSNGINYIVSEEGRLVCFPKREYAARKIDQADDSWIGESGVLASEGTLARNAYEDSQTGWTFVNAYDEGQVLAPVRRTERMIIAVSVLIMSLIGVTIFRTIRGINRSVSTIVSGMKKVQEGDLDQKITVQNRDELGMIADNFNLMTARIKELLTEVTDAKDRQREAELHALEAQINPHFLYNTLDSINWMAIEHGEKDISRALRNLGLILRHTISRSDATVTVGETAQFLDRYFELQDIRYEGAFRAEVQMAEEVEDYRIHKLLIQPFVENAIIHGFAGIEEGGLLTVRIDRSEDRQYLQISIADNGHGFEPELAEIMNNRQAVLGSLEGSRGLAAGTGGIGLRSAFTRAAMYYGDKAHWNINSVKGVGTEITLYIPAEEVNGEKA